MTDEPMIGDEPVLGDDPVTRHGPLIDDEPLLNKPLIGVALAVAIAAFGGWFYWHRHSASAPPAPAATVPAAAPVPAAAQVAIEHPVPPAVDASTPLPELNDSDAALHDALAGAAGGSVIAPFLVPESIIRHIVVTVDNLPRQKVAVEKRPIVATAGTFAVDGDELHGTLDVQNFQRYRPLVEVLQHADLQRLAAVYLRFYPLFQKAYQDLGYPNGYFNDRLVQVIDVLLATPQVAGPIALERPNVMYAFADPGLEARPAGQKLLIRMGPDNAAAVKAKLMELRAILTSAPPKR
jgi:hypothetical protein